jgi:kynurenine formamidase
MPCTALRAPARRLALAACGALALACAGRAASPLEGRPVDLSHAFDETTLYWPGGEAFSLEVVKDGETPDGGWYRAKRFSAAEHGGTHLDAPSHFAKDGASADAIPLERLVGPGVVVNVLKHCGENPECLVGVEQFAVFESIHGRIPPHAVVLIRTGWGRRWPDRAAYLGSDDASAAGAARLRFPGLDPEAARWLAEERRVDAVGIDTASIDRGSSTDFAAHRALAARGVPVFENVAGLEQLPRTGFIVAAFPMKIGRGSGAPLRLVAFVPDEDQ